MNILNIPFVKLLGIKRESSTLSLEPKEELNNHINTVHAGVIYTLAETQSGLFLQEQFSEFKDVVPLLRSSNINYKKPTTLKIKAFATASSDDLVKFKEQFLKKGRATIIVHVEVKDDNSVLIAKVELKWFVQKSKNILLT